MMFGRIHLWERLAWLGVAVCLSLITLVSVGVSRSRVAQAVQQQQAAIAETGQVRAELQRLRKTEPAEGTGAELPSVPGSVNLPGDAEKVPAETRERLIADLQKHPALIPHPGVLGGTMGFYDPQGIHILGPRWVLANFEDGHIDGRALLAYRITAGGRIEWRLLDSYLNE